MFPAEMFTLYLKSKEKSLQFSAGGIDKEGYDAV